jgi:AbrB family looped-hinge helix DNA binding protein
MPAPKGKHLFGMVKVGEKGQIVIPKDARKLFDIKPGDSLVVLGEDDTRGIALMKSEEFLKRAQGIFNIKECEEDDE